MQGLPFLNKFGNESGLPDAIFEHLGDDEAKTHEWPD